jgi:hypothetical protein
MEMACRLIITQNLCGLGQYKDFEGLSSSKNMVFDVKKLLNIGVDLTLWQRGVKK